MTPEEISKLIDIAYNGVEKNAKFGPMFFCVDPDNLTNQKLNPAAFSVFSVILNCLMKKEAGNAEMH